MKEVPAVRMHTGSVVDASLHKLKSNPWMASTIVLAIALVIVLFFMSPSATLKAVSKQEIGQTAVAFINTQLLQGQGEVTLDSVAEKSGLYEVNVLYNGQNVPTYFTKDGFYFVQGVVPLTAEAAGVNSSSSASAEVPKSAKPTAELFIFSYCPAGTAALDSFAKVGALLGKVADVKVKFFSNMHGEHEKQENMIQECIQQVAADKYWAYANQYVAKIYNVCGATKDVSCDMNESVKLMKLVGIDSKKVLDCVATSGAQLYAAEQIEAGDLGLQYSPSIVINGVLADTDRTPEGIKSAVCNAFNSAPTECSQTLSASGTASSGNCGS